MPTPPEDRSPAIISRAEAKARGMQFYFTGRACKNGHVAKRYVETWRCHGCQLEWGAEQRANDATRDQRLDYGRAYRQANAERLRVYRLANREQERAQQRKAKAASPEKQRGWNKAYYAANKEKELARSKAYQLANKEAVAAKQRDWKQANPDAVNAIRANRRARELNAEGSYTQADIARLFKLQKGRCAECRTSIKRGHHVDHILPLIKGGSNWPANLQLLCQSCNNRKYDKDPIEWAKLNGRLL